MNPTEHQFPEANELTYRGMADLWINEQDLELLIFAQKPILNINVFSEDPKYTSYGGMDPRRIKIAIWEMKNV